MADGAELARKEAEATRVAEEAWESTHRLRADLLGTQRRLSEQVQQTADATVRADEAQTVRRLCMDGRSIVTTKATER